MHRGRSRSRNKAIAAAPPRSALIAIFAEHSTPPYDHTIISNIERRRACCCLGDGDEAS
jgi:hypothetical protein